MEKENTYNFTLSEEIRNACDFYLSDNIDKIYLMNASDCVFENGNVRVKRKYGKFKRTIHRFEQYKKG